MVNDLKLDDCVNDACPWSGKPVSADSLTRYRGRVVGFCNPGCRDKFNAALSQFNKRIDVPGQAPANLPGDGHV
jgi:hypothetical protein